MHTYPAGHKYHRSEQDFARDLSLILALPIRPKTKKDIINSVLWKWTERFGKYEGCQCSAAAYKHYRLYGRKTLRHDHAVPRNVLTEMIMATRHPLSPAQMLKLLREFCVA